MDKIEELQKRMGLKERRINIGDISDPKLRKYFENELKKIIRPKNNTEKNRKIAKKERKKLKRLNNDKSR